MRLVIQRYARSVASFAPPRSGHFAQIYSTCASHGITLTPWRRPRFRPRVRFGASVDSPQRRVYSRYWLRPGTIRDALVQKSNMNLPNSLTLLRIFFVPLLVAVLLVHSPNTEFWGVSVHFEEWGVIILAIAAATDWLDGMLARRRGEVTTLGILLDPIADKLLITAAFISLVDMDLVPAWMVVIIIGREFTVLGLRNIASAEGLTIEASGLGKTKMVLQVVAACTVILSRRYPALHMLGYSLLWLVVLFAILSAVQYFLKFWSQVDDRVKRRRMHLGILERRKKTQEVATPPASLERHET
jgi:CDP-diacylglycerol---glycerol-3-phosphate 3-phosphatidyltransferase